jgi:UDPglucose 6-dehydrogenase
MSATNTLTIEIVGAGTVGSATGRALADWGHDVVFKDVDDETLSELAEAGYRTALPDEAVPADLALICVPTPYDQDADTMRTDVVNEVFATLSGQDPHVVAVRSTVPPGTTARLAAEHGIDHCAMVPEFLFADSAREDLESMDVTVIGSHSREARRVIKTAFEPQVSTFVEATPTEAEFIKFGSNLFAATKISFSNEIWRLASSTQDAATMQDDVDPDRILAGVRQISPWFGADMGMEGGWPYGGHCLPKDTRGLRAWAQNDRGVLVPQLSGTIAENDLVDSYTQTAEESGEEPTPLVSDD